MELNDKIQLGNLNDKVFRMTRMGLTQEEIMHSFSKAELALLEKHFGEDIEKGKKGNIGEVRKWSDGNYRKTATGWEKVVEGKKDMNGNEWEGEYSTIIENAGKAAKEGKLSEGELATFKNYQTSTEKELKELPKGAIDKLKEFGSRVGKEKTRSELKVEKTVEYMKKHGMQATSNQVIQAMDGANEILSPKEIEAVKEALLKDEEDRFKDGTKANSERVQAINDKTKEKAPETVKDDDPAVTKKDTPKYKEIDYDSVREWSGEDITNKDINDVLESLMDEADITFSEMKVKRGISQEMFSDSIQNKVSELYNEVRSGFWPARMSKREIRDILWGVVMAKNS